MSNEKVFPEGLLGKKLGMTQIFTEDGSCVPVTAIQLGPNYVLEVKRKDTHGYDSVKLGFEAQKMQRVSKAERGASAKAGKGVFSTISEVRCDVEALGWIDLGKELKASDVFAAGEIVDVSGVSIGRGFSGVFRRFQAGGQPATRGTHEYRRHIGAIGCRKFPGRVFKNKKMPGRHGNFNTTTQNLTVMGVNPDENIILIKGGVPGHKGAMVVVRKAIKGYEKRKRAA